MQRSTFVIALSALAMPASMAYAITETAALTGQQAPGTPGGVLFQNLAVGAPSLNASGRVAFRAFLTGAGVTSSSDSGVWAGDMGMIDLIAREGSALISVPGGELGNVFSPIVNNNGPASTTAFSSELAAIGGGPIANNSAVWVATPSSITLVAREGSQAPGAAVGVVFADFANQAIVFADNGSNKTSFLTKLAGPGVTTANDFAIFNDNGGVLQLVAREGAAAPSLPNTFAVLGAPVLNDNNVMAFQARVSGSSTADNTIWVGGPGSLSMLVREGQAAPGTASNFGNFGNPSLNNLNHVAFLSSLSGAVAQNLGVFTNAGGVMQLVARKGDVATGTLDTYASFSSPVIGGGDHIGFTATLSTAQVGLWAGSPGSMNLIALQDSQAPDTTPGMTFVAISDPLLNSGGQLAFYATLDGIATPSEDAGIWLADLQGDYLKVVQEGQSIQVAPADFRTVSTVSMLGGSGGQDGKATGLNDWGQVAYQATFTDLSSGIMLYTPELHWRETGAGADNWNNANKWTLTLNPAQVHHVYIDPDTNTTVQGPVAPATVRSLTIGGGAGSAMLVLNPAGAITATEGLTILSNGGLSGSGTITGDVLNDGLVAVGTPLLPGVITVNGDYAQGSGGLLQLKIAGLGAGQFDVLDVSGDFTAGGDLSVAFINGYNPTAGDYFDLITYGGTFFPPSFDTETVSIGSPGFVFSFQLINNAYRLVVVESGAPGPGTQAVPEPITASLFGASFALLGFAALRRRREA